jgi:hypothetical protein
MGSAYNTDGDNWDVYLLSLVKSEGNDTSNIKTQVSG